MAIRQIVDIISNIVSQLNYTFVIDSVVDNGNGTYTLASENTYYCSKYNKVTIGGLVYKIEGIVFNVSITVRPFGHSGDPLLETSFELPAPAFFHGTVNSANTEITKSIEIGLETYPIVYLNEILRERFVADELSSLERTSPIKLYFLGLTSYGDNLNPDFLEEILKPMSNVETKFFEVLNKDTNIGLLTDDWTRTNIPRFARTNENGETELIFSEQLSGLEIEITIPINKCCDC